MTAFALALAIFASWSVIGWSVLSIVHSRRNLLQNALLSPVMGAAVLLLVVFELNRFGLPVRIAGPAASVLVLSLVGLGWRGRAPLPVRRLMPWLAVLAAAALLTGYPLFLHGFDWLSFSNDDMANYVLSAHAFVDQGYPGHVDVRTVAENRDPSLLFWLDQILMGARCGSELTLAWVISVTGRMGHEIFMPVMLALHLMLVSAAGALVCTSRKARPAALATGVILSASALMTLSTLYQLISQVWGLALLCGAAVFLLRPLHGVGGWRRALPGAVFCAALGVAYPEALPFFGLGFLLYQGLGLARGRQRWRPLAATVLRTSVCALLMLHVYIGSTLAFLQNQAGKGLNGVVSEDVLFPFYLVPSGLAVFWGLLPIGAPENVALLGPRVMLGALLLLMALWASVWQTWRGSAAGTVALVMLGLAARLFSTRTDFGLFKLSLYIQPFLIGTCVVAWLAWTARRATVVRWGLPALVVLAGLPAQMAYVKASAGLSTSVSGFVEIPNASQSRLISHLKRIAAAPHTDTVLSDTSNVVLAKVQALYLRPASQRYPAKNFFSIAMSDRWTALVNWPAEVVRRGFVRWAADLRVVRYARFKESAFDMRDGRMNTFETEDDLSTTGSASVLVSGPGLSVVNRRRGASMDAPFELVPWASVRNHLVLIESALGKNYYHAGRYRAQGLVSLYQPEPDLFFPGRTMMAAGRTLLFEVLNPTPGARLALEYTATLNGGGRNLIPGVDVIGATRERFPVTGYGSARVVSPPMVPQQINGRSFVAIDMGEAPQRFPSRREGIMALWGRQVPIDTRSITGFVRDLSLVSASDYAAMASPSSVRGFPEGLGDRNLEYSGIYEDGWVGPSCWLRLRQPANTPVVVVRAMIPGFASPPTTVVMTVDGGKTQSFSVAPGDIVLRMPIDSGEQVRHIEIAFNAATRLAAPDDRMVSALLRSVAFEADGREEIAAPAFTLGDGWYPFERWNGESFRWVAEEARVSLNADAVTVGTLQVDLAPGPALSGRAFSLSVRDAAGEHVVAVPSGRTTLRIPLTLRKGPNDIRLTSPRGTVLVPGDPRTLSFRVFGMQWRSRSAEVRR